HLAVSKKPVHNLDSSADSKMIGIDGAVDLIDYNDEILVINHISIERIFNMDNKFSETATTMLQQLSNNNKIGNFNTFEEDCLNDKRIQKTLTKMASEEIDWEHCLDRFENVVNIIDTFDLDIDYQRAPQEQVNYENKGQLMDFVRLIRDAYYKTMINEQIGVDNGI
ncbi:Kiwa anti-phage protein KwaB-like domain-containing protein, partial [Weissella confusa]|uniref:Kiwa anti-phage protein KwaB-like domain-containing protein n=1 Tax=Weissella confusa TaxID=1583 RepID=UPI0022E50020